MLCLVFVFSGTLFFSFLADADTEKYETSVSAEQAEATEKINQERCRLEADVRLFQSLLEKQSRAFQTAVPCERILIAEEGVRGTVSQTAPESLVQTMREMVSGYPLEAMIPVIAGYDRAIAALIVGIAKKESDWGKRIPRDANGSDCFNYWGYKGAGSRGVVMGYGCFGSQEEAVAVIGERLKTLVALRQGSEPKDLIVWKCGSSCHGHSDAGVKKWIADVAFYYDKIVIQ